MLDGSFLFGRALVNLDVGSTELAVEVTCLVRLLVPFVNLSLGYSALVNMCILQLNGIFVCDLTHNSKIS